MKKCFKCGRRKPLRLFYKHKGMADGHLGKCKSCTKKDVKKRYYSDDGRKKVREYEQKRSKNAERKKKVSEYQKKIRAKYPGKARAWRIVSNAIRDGKLQKLPCIKCGDTKSQAHHIDYRRPMYIEWLCFNCHRKAHGQKVYVDKTG